MPSGLDLDGDGRSEGPDDAWGYGRHPGQYGMLVLSRYPIDAARVRSFQHFRWAQMPGALRPLREDGTPWHPDPVWRELRLSSKSHWDVPVRTPLGELHFLVSHPTPPVFDGAEDRNGRRNHDEIRLWADYIDPARGDYLVDDAGRRGGLGAGRAVRDRRRPQRRSARRRRRTRARSRSCSSIRACRRNRCRAAPARRRRRRAARANAAHRGDPAHDTGKFGGTAGNLRIDYVLPSRGFAILRRRRVLAAGGGPGGSVRARQRPPPRLRRPGPRRLTHQPPLPCRSGFSRDRRCDLL